MLSWKCPVCQRVFDVNHMEGASTHLNTHLEEYNKELDHALAEYAANMPQVVREAWEKRRRVRRALLAQKIGQEVAA